MLTCSRNIENSLLESEAGRAVFDNLIQANVDPNRVPLATIKEMLLAECQHLRHSDALLMHA